MLLLQILAATCPGIVDVKLGRLVRTRNKFVSLKHFNAPLPAGNVMHTYQGENLNFRFKAAA